MNVKRSGRKWRSWGYVAVLVDHRKKKKAKLTVVPIIIGIIGSVPKSVTKRLEELEINGKIRTIQTTALLKSVRYWGGCSGIEGNFLPLDF